MAVIISEYLFVDEINYVFTADVLKHQHMTAVSHTPSIIVSCFDTAAPWRFNGATFRSTEDP